MMGFSGRALKPVDVVWRVCWVKNPSSLSKLRSEHSSIHGTSVTKVQFDV